MKSDRALGRYLSAHVKSLFFPFSSLTVSPFSAKTTFFRDIIGAGTSTSDTLSLNGFSGLTDTTSLLIPKLQLSSFITVNTVPLLLDDDDDEAAGFASTLGFLTSSSSPLPLLEVKQVVVHFCTLIIKVEIELEVATVVAWLSLPGLLGARCRLI